jgi:hypothetical protein
MNPPSILQAIELVSKSELGMSKSHLGQNPGFSRGQRMVKYVEPG